MSEDTMQATGKVALPQLKIAPNYTPNASLSMIPGRRLAPNRCALGEERRNVWFITPDDGTVYEDLFKPEYWGFVASKFRMYDRIEVIPDDGSFFAELIVVARGNSTVKVRELRKVELPDANQEDNDELGVKWAGPHSMFRIYKKASGATVKDGYATKEAAMAEIASNFSRPIS